MRFELPYLLSHIRLACACHLVLDAPGYSTRQMPAGAGLVSQANEFLRALRLVAACLLTAFMRSAEALR